jgi:PhnB protein
VTRTRLQPELWVDLARDAIAFYREAFGAEVQHLVAHDDEVVAQLAIDGAPFWVTSAGEGRPSPRSNGAATGRVLLETDDPAALLQRAVQAGASELAPVSEEHGWLLGRILDPYGHEWEIGRPTGDWPPSR